jgi:hypothetical protein
MSVKSKLKTAGVALLKYTVIPWLIDRYVQGAANRLLKNAFGALTGDNPAPSKIAGQLAGTLQGEFSKLKAQTVAEAKAEFDRQMDAMRLDLEARVERGLGRQKVRK